MARRSNPALFTRTRKKSLKTELLMGKRAQRIPSWPGVIHSNKGRIHLRRPTCDILTFRLRRSGGPYIPVRDSPLLGGNRQQCPRIRFWDHHGLLCEGLIVSQRYYWIDAHGRRL